MILNHESITIETPNQEYRPTFIFLSDNSDDEVRNIVSQVISLDIRGDYSFFLDPHKNKEDIYLYEWSGNMFHVIVCTETNNVSIVYLLGEDQRVFNVDYDGWIEALRDWKEFYLNELGFKYFSKEALNHMFGVLILAFDLMDSYEWNKDLFIEAMKKCANRFGVKVQTIYADCKRVTGVERIEMFYRWAYLLMGDEEIEWYDPMTNGIMNKIDEVAGGHSRFTDALRKYIGIQIA